MTKSAKPAREQEKKSFETSGVLEHPTSRAKTAAELVHQPFPVQAKYEELLWALAIFGNHRPACDLVLFGTACDCGYKKLLDKYYPPPEPPRLPWGMVAIGKVVL